MTWSLVLLLPPLAAALLTWVVRRYALARNVLDHPNERSSHAVPTPRGGGLAIVLVALAAWAALALAGKLDIRGFFAVAGASGFVAAIGWWDDHSSLSSKARFLAHLVAAAWGLAWLGGMPPLDLGPVTLAWGWFGHLVGLVSLAWLLNLYNFMDGIDGIAGVEVLTAAGGAALLLFLAGDRQWALAGTVLATAGLGFLVWNWPPAKIFMGDVGSGFLGIALGLLAIGSAVAAPHRLWWWVILLAVFEVDATFTLVRRMLRRESWHEAHRSPAYQHAAQRWGHLPVTVATTLINVCWLLPLAWLASLYPRYAALAAAVACLPLVGLCVRFGAGTPDGNLQPPSATAQPTSN